MKRLLLASAIVFTCMSQNAMAAAFDAEEYLVPCTWVTTLPVIHGMPQPQDRSYSEARCEVIEPDGSGGAAFYLSQPPIRMMLIWQLMERLTALVCPNAKAMKFANGKTRTFHEAQHGEEHCTWVKTVTVPVIHGVPQPQDRSYSEARCEVIEFDSNDGDVRDYRIFLWLFPSVQDIQFEEKLSQLKKALCQ